jgi:chromosome segregation ATPase
VAASAIKEGLKRLGDAVKTRAADKGDEYWIDGDRDELLVRAGLMMEQPERCLVDSNAEITTLRAENDRLRAENADLRAKLADANTEIERLKNALQEKAVKLAASSETNPTVDDVVMAARGREFEVERAEPRVFGEKEIA